MKKKYTISFTLIVLAVLIGLYVFKTNINSAILEKKVINTINKCETIDFPETTDFEWDNLYIIEPYSNVNALLNEESISSPNKNYAIKSDDSIYMIAFIKDNKLIQYIDLPIKHITILKRMDNSIKFSRQHSKFNISKENAILIPKSNIK